MDGRWTIEEDRLAGGWPDASECPMPVVPCDDAAIERLDAWIKQCIKDDAWPTAESCVDVLVGGEREQAAWAVAGETPSLADEIGETP